MPLRSSYARKTAKPYAKATSRGKQARKLATVKQVKRLINANVDKVEEWPTSTTGAITIAGLVKNVANYTNLGGGSLDDDIILDKVALKFYITNVTNANNIVRLILVNWKDGSTAFTSAGQLMTGSGINAPINRSGTADAFEVLMDKTYKMNLFDKSTVVFNLPYLKDKIRLRYDPNGSVSGLYLLSMSLVDTNTTQSALAMDIKYHKV